jgi:hypothetical protein
MGIVADLVDATFDAVSDVLEAAGDAVEWVGEVVVDTIEYVVENPVEALIQVGAASVGIPPPVTAAAITAAKGGDLEDIGKAALGAYAGQYVGSKVGSAVVATNARFCTPKCFIECCCIWFCCCYKGCNTRRGRRRIIPSWCNRWCCCIGS